MGQTQAALVHARRRVVLQVLLAILAMALVFVVVDAVENGADSIIPGLTNTVSSTRWALVLLPLVAVILCIELYLLVTRRVGPTEDPVATMLLFVGADPPANRTLLMGCHGCGTLFSHDGVVDSPFKCPNCGRKGAYRGSRPVTAPIIDVTCASCAKPFESYLEHAECPHCHTAQA